MTQPLSNRCVGCGRKLRDALFCHNCGQAACSWECLSRHRAQESAPARPRLAAPDGFAPTDGFMEAAGAPSAL